MADEGKTVMNEDFSRGMENWWVEGGQKVWVEDSRLHVKANLAERRQPGEVCTVWYRHELPGDIRVEFDAHVIESVSGVNNINCFLSYSDPSGAPLYETRASRADASYAKYHDLTGYIFTFLKGEPAENGMERARFRMRRCPGFELLTETFDYHCRAGVTYRVAITRKGPELTLAVDGTTYLRATDPDPIGGGLFGLRTYQTYLWWDNITVTSLE